MIPDAAFIEILVASLRQGVVLVLRGEIPFESEGPHFFIILNQHPDTDEYLIVANNTSKVASRLIGLAKQGDVDVGKTTVVFEPGRYSFFPDQTLFDCNSIHEISHGELLQAYSKGNLWVASEEVKLSDEDMQRICDAALKSRSVSPVNKRLINARLTPSE